jgi:hypothetical protein
MPLERTDVAHPLWRKKVDGSLLRHGVTPIPSWVAKMWSIAPLFPDKRARRDPGAKVTLTLGGQSFGGAVTWYERPRGKAYRLWLDEELRLALAQTFVMSHMRDLEFQLRGQDVEEEVNDEAGISFWEFLDIEFDNSSKTFRLCAYFTQRPSFPQLFRRLADAPPLKRIRDELAGKAAARIHKQSWRPRSDFETEIGATNVIYMLLDSKRRLLYVGETENLVARFRRTHAVISDWDYYRYDALPAALASHRVTLERMLIRDIDSLIGSSASGLPCSVSDFQLANLRIDTK